MSVEELTTVDGEGKLRAVEGVPSTATSVPSHLDLGRSTGRSHRVRVHTTTLFTISAATAVRTLQAFLVICNKNDARSGMYPIFFLNVFTDNIKVKVAILESFIRANVKEAEGKKRKYR